MIEEAPFARIRIERAYGPALYASSANPLLAADFRGLKPVEDKKEASIYTRYRAGVLIVMLTSLRVFDKAIIEPVTFAEWVESTK